jgi:hypothetical protein
MLDVTDEVTFCSAVSYDNKICQFNSKEVLVTSFNAFIVMNYYPPVVIQAHSVLRLRQGLKNANREERKRRVDLKFKEFKTPSNKRIIKRGGSPGIDLGSLDL